MTFANPGEMVSFAIKNKLPEWQTKLFAKYRNEIQVHSKGQLFYKIDRLFPNEDPRSKDHRLLSFEPVTKSSFNKAVTNIMRIFHNSSYDCYVSEETTKIITENNFDNKNLFSYFLEQWSTWALALDPNSLVVVYPPEFMKDKSFNQVTFVSSEHIVYFDHDTFIFKSEEESVTEQVVQSVSIQNERFWDNGLKMFNIRETAVNSYNEVIKTRFVRTVYHAFIQNKFYRIEQPLEGEVYDVITYDLPMKIPPVCFSGGMKAEKKLYESFLSPFVPFGNLALLQHSQHTAVNFMFSFPRMSEVQSECENQLCKDGYVDCDVSVLHPDGSMPCPNCHGSGYHAVQTPYKIYVKKQNNNGPEQDVKTMMETPSVEFYQPPTDTLKYSKQEWQDYLTKAEMSVFIDQKIETGNVESAKKVELDMNEFYGFLSRIAKVFYNDLRFVIQCFENYTVPNPPKVSVIIPFSFAILTEDEAFEALNKILTSNAPDVIKGNRVESFILKFVSASSPVKKAYNVLKQVDLLLLKNDSQISTLKSNNIVTGEQWSIHTFSYPLLMQMYSKDENLFEQDIATVAKQLNTELALYKPEEEPSLTTALQNKFKIV